MSDAQPKRLKIAIAIATANRRDGLSDTIAFLSRQTRRADAFLICPAKPQDVDEARLADYGAPIEVIPGPTGLPKQRNVLMAASDADIIVFFDDDFLPADTFIAETEALFLARPDIVIATGKVLADGANGPGILYDDAVATLAADQPPQPPVLTPTYGGYGCNMAFRLAVAKAHDIRFDENLPLYGWWEDIDFSRRLAPYGKIMNSNALRGVHLGSKSGRTSGVKLGYSQIANIIYMQRKGSVSGLVAVRQVLRNLIANHLRYFKPEAWVDRAGRIKGNWIALTDILKGRMHPERILEL